MQKLFLISVILFLPAISLAEELTIAVAASVAYPFEELKKSFQEETGITLQSVTGSSGQLTLQIENGAPFDIFLSADTRYPEVLHKKGLTFGPPKIYAYGVLVLWTMDKIDLSEGVKILTDSRIQKIALASPQIAPYGREAMNVLKYYDLYSKVGEKLVYGQSVTQVNQFIVSQTADVGFTAKSVVLAPEMKNQGQWIELEKGSYQPIAQTVVILKHAQEKKIENAQKFFDFLSSKSARKIFEEYGYILP